VQFSRLGSLRLTGSGRFSVDTHNRLCSAPLFDIIAQHLVRTHHYADELQLYLCVQLVEALISADRLDACLVDDEACWKPYSTQAKLRLCGSAQQLANVQLHEVPVLSSQVRVINTVRNLDVVVEIQLSMSAHGAAVYRGGYYQLWQLRQLKRGIKLSKHACVHR